MVTYPASPLPVYGCYRHPDRGTRIGCQRCGRPICGECMVTAPVGFHCPECVVQARAAVAPALARAQRAGVKRQFMDSPITFVLLALNALVWLAIQATGGDASRLGDVLALRPTGLADGAYWQLLTSAFTHVSVMHVAFNLFALWVLGPQLERALGWARYLALYLISALAGSVAVYWLSDPQTSTLGASGAVFGLMGALLVLAWRGRGDVRNILFWLGANLLFTFAAGPGISWQGHLGGLLGGAAVAAVLAFGRRERWTPWALVGLVVVLLVLVAARSLMLA